MKGIQFRNAKVVRCSHYRIVVGLPTSGHVTAVRIFTNYRCTTDLTSPETKVTTPKGKAMYLGPCSIMCHCLSLEHHCKKGVLQLSA